MNRISVRGVAVASATAVTAVGAVVGVANGSSDQPTAQVADVAGSTLLAEIPSGSQAQTVSDNISRQADAQQAEADAAAQKAAAEAARLKAASAAKAKAAADKAARAHADALAASRAAARATITQNFTPGSVKAIALSIVGADQFECFSNIVTRESGWNYTAQNPSSGAYGLVQALPGDKMASVGDDWRTNPATQIKWGLKYM
ncbi:MAG TPA: hypothetical protein VGD48_11215, partial [Kutzneria sp.]